MATFRKRGAKWQAQVRLKGRAPISRSFNLKADAERWARDTESTLQRQQVGAQPTGRITVRELLDRYEAVVTPGKKGRHSETYRLRVLRAHPIADLQANLCAPAMVASYRDDRLRVVSPSSVRRELAVLQHCFEVARTEWGLVAFDNPVGKIKKPQQARARDRRLEPGEFERLEAALAGSRNTLLKSLVSLAIHTGMRRSEMLSVRWCDLDAERCTLVLTDTKNGHPRDVPLGPGALAALPMRPAVASDTDPVFHISANALRLAWERLKRRAGVHGLRFHDLRHEAISRFFELGLSVPEVGLISGHKDARMLMRYTHLKAENVASRLMTLQRNPEQGSKND